MDVSQNTALQTLSCSTNQLTTLDVSNNTALRYLYCYDNQLTVLDLSKNSMLMYLWCHQNQFKGAEMDALVESLPTVSNGNMYVIYSEDEENVMTTAQVSAANAKGWIVYSYNGSGWQEYTVSEPTFTDVAIYQANFPDVTFLNWVLSQEYGSDGVLTCEEIVDITTIDVSNKGIQSLKGIEFFTALEYLSCTGNQLTTLDVSKNTKLTQLYCTENQLTTLDVSNNTALTKLDCGYNQLTTLDVSKNTALVELRCINN